jgi:hypothetical protein
MFVLGRDGFHVTPSAILARIGARIAASPTHTKVLLALATTIFVVELALRRFAPKSPFYAKWTALFMAIGHFWTAILLAIVYFVSVSVIALLVKLFAKDPLDRGLESAPTFWHTHEPNPLGPEAASRHQF